MNTRGLLVGAATGSALMFLMDPDRGRRRRALIRNQVTRASRKTRDGVDATARDIANRAGGMAAAARGRLFSGPVDDVKLVQRVRSKLGRVCSHPHAIEVEADDGQVTIRGPVLASEVMGIVTQARAVRGVTGVTNELEPYETAEGVPALQGEGRLAGPSFDVLQSNWAPATRAMMGAGLLAALWMGFRSRRA